jgi:transposase
MDEIPLERRRILAAEMLLRSERPTEISRRTGLSLPTLRNYKALLDSGGPDALARLAPHGKKSRLDDSAQSWLISAVKHSPELHGFSTPVWTVDQVRSVILARYGIQYSSSHVARLMRDWGLGYRLTYTSVVTEAKGRAQRRLSERDAERRRQAAKMLLSGQSAENVSEVLNIGLPTVKSYASMLEAGGLEALEKMTSRGHNPLLDSGALRRLKVALEKGPPANGFESQLWKNRDVQTLIKRKFGVYHSAGHVRQLVEKLGLAHCMNPPKRRTEKKRVTLNDDVLAWIVATVQQSPRSHGIDGDHWNNARLRAVVEQRLGVAYSRGYMWEIAVRAGIGHLLTKRRN